MLTLPIKKKWFDMILYGEKKEEYREINSYYITRFKNVGLLRKNYLPTYEPAVIALRNGYRKDSPTMKVRVSLAIRAGKPEWGAKPNEMCYVLEIKEVLSLDAPNEPDVYYPDCDRITEYQAVDNCGDCYRFEICRNAWYRETH